MRSAWLALALVADGCFSEAPSSSACIDGEAACDCRTDGTCDQGLDCVASIDKCVPTGCTPGSESCTCVDGDCLSSFVCDAGVCIPPTVATSGGDASVSATTSTDTVADTTMGTTPGSSTDPATSNSTTPLDTGETDPTGMSGSVSTDPSETTLQTSFTDTGSVCDACILLAEGGGCAKEYEACFYDDTAAAS